MKKLTVALLIATMLLGMTACGSSANQSASATETQTQTTMSEDEINARMNDLANQENDIIAEHQDLWNTVFNSMDKEEAKNSTENNYGKFLETQLDKIKDQFSDEDLQTLNQDIEKIKKIEDQMAELVAQESTQETDSSSASTGESTGKFPDFSAKDLDGNAVDSSIFSQNAVTVVNFWFNACSPCVEELPALNKLNEELKDKGGQVIGVNADALDGNKDGIADAKGILKKQGANYVNLALDSDSEAGQYTTNIMAFPTTVLVDRSGNIIGDPILGGINNDDVYDQVMKTIDEIIAKDQK